jgi:hypothetical protein
MQPLPQLAARVKTCAQAGFSRSDIVTADWHPVVCLFVHRLAYSHSSGPVQCDYPGEAAHCVSHALCQTWLCTLPGAPASLGSAARALRRSDHQQLRAVCSSPKTTGMLYSGPQKTVRQLCWWSFACWLRASVPAAEQPPSAASRLVQRREKALCKQKLLLIDYAALNQQQFQ